MFSNKNSPFRNPSSFKDCLALVFPSTSISADNFNGIAECSGKSMLNLWKNIFTASPNSPVVPDEVFVTSSTSSSPLKRRRVALSAFAYPVTATETDWLKNPFRISKPFPSSVAVSSIQKSFSATSTELLAVIAP